MVEVRIEGKQIRSQDIKNLIVGGQHGTDEIRFKIASPVNGVDLTASDWAWFLIFENKAGQGEPISLNVSSVDNDYVYLDWTPGKTVTQVYGKIEIQVYAVKKVENVIISQWPTIPAVIYVEKSLNPQAITQVVPTVIEQYLDRMITLKDSAEASATSSAESAATALAQANFAIAAASESVAAANFAGIKANEASSAAESSAASASIAIQKAGDASGSANIASESASTAATKAGEATVSAAEALSSSETAISKASESLASQQAASSAKSDAEAAKLAAQTAQGLSEQAREASVIAKTAAETANGTAEGHANAAGVSAGQAAGSAATAGEQAGVASTKANEAEQAKIASETAKGLAETARVGAETAQGLAQTAKTGAELARDKAQAWAENPENAEVESGKFSALHHAIKAEQTATELAASLAQIAENTVRITENQIQSVLKNSQQDVQLITLQKQTEISAQQLFSTAITRYAPMYKIGVDEAGSVVAIPVAGAVELVMKGRTGTNIVLNGDFSSGTDWWLPTNSTLGVSGKILSVTGNGTAINPRVYIVTNTSTSPIYIRLRIRVTNALCTRLWIYWSDTTSGSIFSKMSPVENQWYEVSVLSNMVDANSNNQIYFSQEYADATTAAGKVMQIDGDYGVMAVNLIQSGESDIMLTQCVERYGKHFNSTASCGPMRYRIVGANLANRDIGYSSSISLTDASRYKIRPYSIVKLSCSAVINATTWRFGVKFFRDGVDITSTISLSDMTNSAPAYYLHSTGFYINGADTTNRSQTFLPNANIDCDEIALILCVGAGTSSATKTVDTMLNLGSSALPYETFQQSSVFDPYVKRSVHAIADRFFRSGGQWWHEKNVSEPAELPASGWASLVTYTNTYRVEYTNWLIGKNVAKNISGSGLGYCDDGFFPITPSASSPDSRGISLGASGTTDTIYVRVEQTKIDAMPGASILSKFNAYLLAHPITLLYKLAIPDLTPIPSGEVLGFANSTAFVEAWDEEVVECTEEGQITCSYKPVTIESLKAYDGGYEWEVVADSINGNTVYISEAVVGYVYKIAHYYSDETMVAKTEVKPATKNLVTKITALEAKVGAAVPNATSETALTQLNALLASLRTAGLLMV